MRPNPILLFGVGLCVGSANGEYLYLPDGLSTTSAQYRSQQQTGSQTQLKEDFEVVVHEKPETLEGKIDALISDADNFEEGEPLPSDSAVSDLKRILSETSELSGTDIPDGDVLPYFGELSITWRRGSRMLRLTAFSNGKRPRLDFGTTPVRSLGAYQFDPAATAESLIRELNRLATDDVARRTAGA